LTAEGEGNLKVASRWLDDAISHSRRDYQLWLRAAIIETKRGNALAAKRDLAEARRLNPNYRQLLAKSP
jgi:Tfp pilus assembly protein PilF